MDREREQRRQSLKVLLSEAIMVLAVVATVVILAFVVSGYWLNSEFKVQRQGMLQVSSVPTGANVDIDGESSWLQRTNTSKVISSGEHIITLSKDGYDTWSKTVNVSEGLLYRVHYPRLFLNNRYRETVLDATGHTFATISPKRDRLLLINDTTEWGLIRLNSDKPELKKLNVSNFLSSKSVAEEASVGLFTGEILDVDWDRSGTHLLIKNQSEGKVEWILLNIDNIQNSINLTKEFGVDFTTIQILDDSSNNLLALRDGNLHKISLANKAVSSVLAKNVIDFDHFEDEIVFLSSNKVDNNYEVDLIKSEENPVLLEYIDAPAKVTISKFYDEMYITTLRGDTLSLYKQKDFEHIEDFKISFTPEDIEVGHDGEFIAMYRDTHIATLDMEANIVREWQVDGDNFGWLDNDMIYSVVGGKLMVYDFDGFNRKELAKNVSNHFPVTITNDKWLYYFSDGDLVREWLITR